MFKPGDKVKIDPEKKCGSLKIFFKDSIDCVFRVIDVGELIRCDCEVRGSWKHDVDCNKVVLDGFGPQYWITIEIPDGRKTVISSYWLILEQKNNII